MKSEESSSYELVVFVGAGASAGLGMPTTTKFIDLLRQHWGVSDIDAILKAYKKFSNSKNVGGLNRIQPIVDSEYLRDWFLELRRSAESIEALPKIKSSVVMAKAPQPNTAVKFIDNILADFDSFTRNAYKEVQPDKAYQHYVPLLEVIKLNNINLVPIFTTNYDLVFESMKDCQRCGWDIVTGMKQTGTRVLLDTNLFDQGVPANPTLQVNKLHGSTDWWINKESGQIQQIPLDAKPPEKCLELLIYPTRQKFEQIKEKPFAFYYDRLKKVLSSKTIRVCITIGYSFRDRFINEMFIESIKNGLKLIIFDTAMKQNQLLNEFGVDNQDSSNIINNIHIHNIDFGNWRNPDNRNKFSQILNEELGNDSPNKKFE